MIQLLEASAIRARRRPNAVMYLWLWELVCAWLVTTPIHAWAKAAWGAHPDGDVDLFRPGAHSLLTWLGGSTSELPTVLKTSGLLLVVFAIASQLITGAVIASLTSGDDARRPPGGAFALGVSVHAFLPLGAISLLTLVFEAFVFGVGLFLSNAIDDALKPSLGDARSFTVHLVVVALFALAALAVGVAGDLARTAMVRGITGDIIANERVAFTRRLRSAILAAARASFGRAFAAWGWRALASIALLYVAALAGERMSGVWLPFAVHQLVIAARAALRVSWLANALRLTTTSST
jgi:hypothetical protein